MQSGLVTYTFDGDTFVGKFSVIGARDDEIVVVNYNKSQISATVGHLPKETVAKTLLGELVREDLVCRGKSGKISMAKPAG